jgi:hypothetical protein
VKDDSASYFQRLHSRLAWFKPAAGRNKVLRVGVSRLGAGIDIALRVIRFIDRCGALPPTKQAVGDAAAEPLQPAE